MSTSSSPFSESLTRIRVMHFKSVNATNTVSRRLPGSCCRQVRPYVTAWPMFLSISEEPPCRFRSMIAPVVRGHIGLPRKLITMLGFKSLPHTDGAVWTSWNSKLVLDGALSSILQNLLCRPSGPASESLPFGAATSSHRGSFQVITAAGLGKDMSVLARFLTRSPSSCKVVVDNTGGLATNASNCWNFSSMPDPPARQIWRILRRMAIDTEQQQLLQHNGSIHTMHERQSGRLGTKSASTAVALTQEALA